MLTEAARPGFPDSSKNFDALVIGVDDDRLGQRVAALVQPRDGHSIDLAALESHLRTQIAGYKVPRQLKVVDQIVRHPSGKPDYRWAATTAKGSAPAAVPRSPAASEERP